jgi:hypothetical protein
MWTAPWRILYEKTNEGELKRDRDSASARVAHLIGRPMSHAVAVPPYGRTGYMAQVPTGWRGRGIRCGAVIPPAAPSPMPRYLPGDAPVGRVGPGECF